MRARNRFVVAFRFIGSDKSFAFPLCAGPMPFSAVGIPAGRPGTELRIRFWMAQATRRPMRNSFCPVKLRPFRPFFRHFRPLARSGIRPRTAAASAGSTARRKLGKRRHGVPIPPNSPTRALKLTAAAAAALVTAALRFSRNLRWKLTASLLRRGASQEPVRLSAQFRPAEVSREKSGYCHAGVFRL